MAAPTRSQIERWAGFGTEGLLEMQNWLDDNPTSPFAGAVAQAIATIEQVRDTMLVIAQKARRAELLAQKAQVQAQIDAINAEVGP